MQRQQTTADAEDTGRFFSNVNAAPSRTPNEVVGPRALRMIKLSSSLPKAPNHGLLEFTATIRRPEMQKHGRRIQ